MVGAIVISPLFAACFLFPGEQLRRGGFSDSTDGTTTASVVSSFRPLSLGWHALWSALGLVYCLILLGVPLIELLTVRIIPPFGYMLPSFVAWWVIGIFALPLEAASVVSLYKKAHYLRLQAHDSERFQREAPHAAVWRFVTFRWRLDLWVAGVAGAFLSLIFMLPLAGVLGTLLAGAALVVSGGFFALALWMASNYWKAGRPLGSAESYT